MQIKVLYFREGLTYPSPRDTKIFTVMLRSWVFRKYICHTLKFMYLITASNVPVTCCLSAMLSILSLIRCSSMMFSEMSSQFWSCWFILWQRLGELTTIGQDYKCFLLFIIGECKLFLISISGRDGQDAYATDHAPEAALAKISHVAQLVHMGLYYNIWLNLW